MKRTVCILLIMLLLVSLCACSMMADTSAALEEYRKALEEKPRSPMTVRMSFGPETDPDVELVLDDHFQLVSAQALNEEGGTLLEGIRLENRTHYMLMREILKKAQAADLLHQMSGLVIIAESEDPSIWTFATTDILAIPVEHHKEETGAVFSLCINLPKEAPAQFSPEGLQVFTAKGEDWDYEYYAKANGMPWKTYWTLPDRKATEFDFGDSELDDISLVFYYDGSFEYRRRFPTEKETAYWESPEGSYSETCNSKGSSKTTNSDGTTWEGTYDENGNLLKTKGTEADGRWHEAEFAYDEEGNVIKTLNRDSSGEYSESVYENGIVVKNVQKLADGSYYENLYDDFGNPISQTGKDAEGYLIETIFENGRIITSRRYTEDGSYDCCEVWEWKDEKSGIIHSKTIDGGSVEEYDTEFTTG